MPVLGLETSCDETAAALYDGERGLLAHSLHSQIALHAEYGGVVPELASRDHVRRINPMIREVLARAGVRPDQLTGVAYTAGPGLIGALMVGGAVASGIATAHGLPLIPVHHMEGHLLAPMLEENRPAFPFVALLVSGGHTLLVAVRGVGQYEILGESLDDAVGEAFDKTAKLLGLPYPGGPHLAKLAQQGRPGRFKLPRPMTDRPGLDFSFSGLKTAVLTALKSNGGSERDIHVASPHLGILPGASEQDKADLARAFEEAATETLAIKCTRALEQTGYRALVVAGGVGANLRLRERLGELARKQNIGLFFPRHEFCTDNAAMIAYVGWTRRAQGTRGGALMARPRWPLTELTAV